MEAFFSTFDVNTLINGGLGLVALRLAFSIERAVKVLSARVDGHEKRIDKLEDR